MPAGFLTQHMAAHIVAMNIVAPALVLLLPARVMRRRAVVPAGVTERTGGAGTGGSLAAATGLQLALLWGWHAPAVFATATTSAVLMAAMHLTLFAAALWFWSSVVAAARRGDWAPLGALLITGKLFCLLGLLLAVAPRALYATAAFLSSCFAAGDTFGVSPPVADQQLAGLLMLTACPLVYVTAAIVLAHGMLRRIAAGGWTLSARAPG